MHAMCCYKQTLLEIAGPASRPIGSSQCDKGIARVSGLSVRFVHLSWGGKLRIAGCRFQGAQIGATRTWMQTKGLCRTQFPRGVHVARQSHPKSTKLSLLPWSTWNKGWNGPSWWDDRPQPRLSPWLWQ